MAKEESARMQNVDKEHLSDTTTLLINTIGTNKEHLVLMFWTDDIDKLFSFYDWPPLGKIKQLITLGSCTALHALSSLDDD